MRKLCSGCGLSLYTSSFWKKSSSRDGLQAKCKSCQREEQKTRTSTEAGKLAARKSNKKWLSTPGNHERMKEWQREWAKRNPDWFRQWRENNPDKVVEAQRNALRRGSQDLNDSYVKRAIARGEFSHRAIPSSLVDLKRANLQIHREIKRGTKP